MKRSIITQTGSYIPPERVPNTHFLNREFFDPHGRRLARPNPEIIRKLYEITGIEERRYAPAGICTTDMATQAAEAALAGVDREGIDYIIVAHNFGDLSTESLRSDMVPTIASRVKHRLRIKNPYTVAFDLPFGCPGWLQGMIMADYFIRSGDARRVLVIGAE
ncbi:MAG: ketoacyl-ACP synthase III, partial [Desulfobacteraceae bacterium]